MSTKHTKRLNASNQARRASMISRRSDKIRRVAESVVSRNTR